MLILISILFFGAGGGYLGDARWGLGGGAADTAQRELCCSTALNQLDRQHNQCRDQEHMNEPTHRVRRDQP